MLKITSSLFFQLYIFRMLVVNSLCKNIFLIFFSKFPVLCLSGKMDFQIPYFPCAVTLMEIFKRNICILFIGLKMFEFSNDFKKININETRMQTVGCAQTTALAATRCQYQEGADTPHPT